MLEVSNANLGILVVKVNLIVNIKTKCPCFPYYELW